MYPKYGFPKNTKYNIKVKRLISNQFRQLTEPQEVVLSFELSAIDKKNAINLCTRIFNGKPNFHIISIEDKDTQ